MSLELIISIAGGSLLVAVGVIGYLVVRAINAVDRRIEQLEAKLDAGAQRDNATEVWKAEFSLRLVTVEAKIAELYMLVKGRAG